MERMNHKVSLLLFIDLNVMKRCCENNLFYIAKISHTLLGHIKFDRWVYHLNIIKKKLRQTDEKWKEVSIYFIIINCILIFSMRILWQSEANFFHEKFMAIWIKKNLNQRFLMFIWVCRGINPLGLRVVTEVIQGSDISDLSWGRRTL